MKKLRAIAVVMILGVPAMAQRKPAQVQPPPPPAFQPPTAAEAFNLRSRCVKLADELKKRDDTITLPNWDEPEFDANYDARANRCYVQRIHLGAGRNRAVDITLFDGQTREMLAYARRSDSWQLQSMVFDPQVERLSLNAPAIQPVAAEQIGRTTMRHWTT